MLDSDEPPQPGPRLQLRYLHGGEVSYQPGDSLGPRTLRDFELVYIIEGTVTCEAHAHRDIARPGSFVLSQPGTTESYRWDTQKCTRHAFVHFDLETYPEDWPPPRKWPRLAHPGDPFCAHLFSHLLQHVYENRDGPLSRPARGDCRLLELLIDSMLEPPHGERVSFERDRPEPVRRAMLFLAKAVEETPNRPLSLFDIAQSANVTEKHLCKLFTQWIGFPPVKTFILYKLESARPLLLHTNLSVKEISQRCGFSNQLYFTRQFTKTYGCAPSGFRRQLRDGAPPPPSIFPVDLTTRAR